MSTKFIEMIGRKFGKLTVLELSEYRGKNSRDNYYLCQCDCGSESFETLGTALRRTNKPTLNCRDCGNKKKQKYGNKVKGTKLYKAWDAMKQRCYNERNNFYFRYGGRGIIICNEWLNENGFINFMNWSLENGFDENKSIDRIDNDGNYEPSNCRWTDMKTQGNNKSINKIIEYDGIRKTMSQWAEEYEIPYGTFVKRLEFGWDMERSLNEKVIHKELNKLIEIDGEFLTYKEIGEKYDININTLRARFAKGMRDLELISKVREEMKRR